MGEEKAGSHFFPSTVVQRSWDEAEPAGIYANGEKGRGMDTQQGLTAKAGERVSAQKAGGNLEQGIAVHSGGEGLPSTWQSGCQGPN